jgi:hypothetical protein
MAQLARRIRRIVAVGVMALAVMAISGAPAVSAKSGDIVRTGDCTKTTDWKLKLSPQDGRIEVEFEVDSNRNGQVWDIVLRDNGTILWKAHRTTLAPSGSFEFRKVIGNRAGHDKVTGSARNRSTGETCSAVATF